MFLEVKKIRMLIGTRLVLSLEAFQVLVGSSTEATMLVTENMLKS